MNIKDIEDTLVSSSFLKINQLIQAETKLNRQLAYSQFFKNQDSLKKTATWIFDLQQGDGGKGAAVDNFALNHDIVLRCQGGDNAGHTSVFDIQGKTVKLNTRIIPSGIRRTNCIALLSKGVLLNLKTFFDELNVLKDFDPNIENRVLISNKCFLVLPMHQYVDRNIENSLEKNHDEETIGTTKRGIGPANIARVARISVRVGDLENWNYVCRQVRKMCKFFKLDKSFEAESLDFITFYRDRIKKHLVDCDSFIEYAQDQERSILCEGAQGALIDINSGTYPFVTTSPTGFSSLVSGTSLKPDYIQNRIGILKIYQTMAGEGPFVTEVHGEELNVFIKSGDEKEITDSVQRDRRCGWLDLVSSNWAARSNFSNSIIITKVDVLSSFNEIKICVAYKDSDGNLKFDYDANKSKLDKLEPVYKTFKGWKQHVHYKTPFSDLPQELLEVIDFIQHYLDTEVSAVRVGPHENDLIMNPSSSFGKKLMEQCRD